MKRFQYIWTVLVWTVCLMFHACSNPAADKSQRDKILADSSSTTSQQTNTTATDSLTLQKDELAKIYTQAIAEFIKGVYKRDKTTFDTLFFGKHIFGQPDDFPDIELPETIQNTPVRLITPEIGQKNNKNAIR